MAEKIKFEKALERLEKIVEELESGDIALETALEKYEEGVKLARICQGQLADAEKKIQILNRQADGSLEARDFDPENGSEENEPRKTRPRKKKAADDEDEDSLL